MWAIIGGSGFEKFDGFEVVEELDTETPFGGASSGLKKVRLEGQEILFLSRHGKDHEKLPSEVNYRANIYAFKKYGVKGVLAFSAVGSLRQEFAPGDLMIPTNYLDRTKGVRAHTFCGDGIVGHVSLAHPVCKKAASRVLALTGKHEGWKTHTDGTYVCIEGPYFSTLPESHFYRSLGGDIIGMTNFPEFALAREAGLAYMPCCFVTDYDCWNEERPHVTLDEVLRVMRENNSKAFQIAKAVLKAHPDVMSLWKNGDNPDASSLKVGLMTPKEKIPAKHIPWLEKVLS